MCARGISEIVLIVADVRAAARFYRDVVGLEPMTDADDEWAWFWTGEQGHSPWLAVHKGPLLFEEHSPHPAGSRWGQVHFALHVPRERLDAALAQVRSHGVQVYGPKRFDWMKAEGWYFYDPDGNLVEFWSPDPS
jgi:catechol 2,3-dioxygenase-like lactoylglutathione lyase family enzyme